MPLYALLVLISLNFAVYFGLKIVQSWERVDVLYTIREAGKEGRN